MKLGLDLLIPKIASAGLRRNRLGFLVGWGKWPTLMGVGMGIF